MSGPSISTFDTAHSFGSSSPMFFSISFRKSGIKTPLNCHYSINHRLNMNEGELIGVKQTQQSTAIYFFKIWSISFCSKKFIPRLVIVAMSIPFPENASLSIAALIAFAIMGMLSFIGLFSTYLSSKTP